MTFFLNLARVVGAVAIGLSGVLHVLGQPEVANAVMVLGAGAASPGAR